MTYIPVGGVEGEMVMGGKNSGWEATSVLGHVGHAWCSKRKIICNKIQ